MKKNNFTKNENKGFTLIELMVATSIFVIVMLASMGSLFTLLDTSKNSRALRFAMDNVNFAMESMTRSIRMGTNYYCVDQVGGTMPSDSDLISTSDCSSGGTLVAFVPQSNPTHRVGFRLRQRVSDGTYTLERCHSAGCVEMISSNVKVDKLQFFVKGSSPSDSTQASVYIIMKGTVMVKGVENSFAIQTMASQRNF